MNAPTLLERELREQPAALRRCLEGVREDLLVLPRHVPAEGISSILIAARGSSDNAARFAQYLFGTALGVPVTLAAPSLETAYSAGAVPGKGGLVIGISQSGASPDVCSVVSAARDAGTPTVVITNEPDSDLARLAHVVLNLRAGLERSVAATKTYTATLASLLLLTNALGAKLDQGWIDATPDLAEETIDSAIARAGRFDASAGRYVLVLGRGHNYSTALEIALKVRELTSTLAEGFSPADLEHGPIASVPPHTPVVAVAPPGRVQRSVLKVVERLRTEADAQPLLIGASGDSAFPLPADVPGWLSPLLAVIPGQVLGLRWAELGGGDVDAPAGLTKVTRTL